MNQSVRFSVAERLSILTVTPIPTFVPVRNLAETAAGFMCRSGKTSTYGTCTRRAANRLRRVIRCKQPRTDSDKARWFATAMRRADGLYDISRRKFCAVAGLTLVVGCIDSDGSVVQTGQLGDNLSQTVAASVRLNS